MGWTSQHKTPGASVKSLLTEQFTWENDDFTNKVLDSSLVRFHTWYAAVERIHKTTGTREVWAAVVLVRMHPSSDYNFSYKDMDETCGPNERECPKRILELLTHTDSKYANEWRQDCWDRLNKKRKRLKSGHHILFKRPVEFKGGSRFRLMRIENARKGWFEPMPGAPATHSVYRIHRSYFQNGEFDTYDLDGQPLEKLPLLIGIDPVLDKEIGRRLSKGDSNVCDDT